MYKSITEMYKNRVRNKVEGYSDSNYYKNKGLLCKNILSIRKVSFENKDFEELASDFIKIIMTRMWDIEFPVKS